MACPDDDTILTLVKCKKGILGVSCKGVESLSSYKGDLMDDVYMKFPAFQRMNHHGQSTLKEYFDGQKQGKF